MEYRRSSVREWLRTRRRLVLYMFSFVVVVGVQTLLYWWGMAAFEGDPRSALDSLEIVVQSLTTTGYGEDAPWDSAFVSVLVMTIQFTGIAYLFVALPLFIIPWIRTAIGETTVPEAIEEIDDHVVIYGYSALCSTLVDALEERDRPYVIVENDEEQARELYENGKTVVLGDATSGETLSNVAVRDALAIVIDAQRASRLGTVLGIREFERDVEVLCLIEELEQSQYLRFAGATTVLSPKHGLGTALANKARNVVGTEIDTLEGADIDIEVSEFPVAEGSEIHGRRLAELDGIEATGATLVGAWIRGEFEAPVDAEGSKEEASSAEKASSAEGAPVVDEGAILVVAGTDDQLERVRRLTRLDPESSATEAAIVAGYGLVGTTAEGVLRKAEYDTRVIDAEQRAGVDVVGDATDPETLSEAGIHDAEVLVLALPDDEAAIRATLAGREANPDVEILVAASTAENTSKLYSAGADYVLALPKLAGRMTTLTLFEDHLVTFDERIQLAEFQAPELEGTRLDDAEIRETTDAAVVAVRRDGEVTVDFDDVRMSAGDEVIVAGTERGIEAFRTAYAIESSHRQ